MQLAMRYNSAALNSGTNYYKNALNKIRGKSVLIVIPRFEKRAFLSLASLSKAAHELNKDLKVIIPNKNSKALEVLNDVWACYKDMKRGVKNKATQAMSKFISITKKKIPDFEALFIPPNTIIYATKSGFKLNDNVLDYKPDWYRAYRLITLKKTCKLIWDKVFGLKQHELVNCSFELIPNKDMLELPLEDYLDNFAIMLQMVATCPGKLRLSTATTRKSQLEKPERISELLNTLLGCELEKEIKEPVFRAYNLLSKELKLSRLDYPDTIFTISGKGYYGMHAFGERIGYPTLNRKSRWQSPTQLMLKLPFYPQTRHEERPPITRIGFTETLPIDNFINSCNIDWDAMRATNKKLKKKIQGCNELFVEGKKKDSYKTELRVIIKNRKIMLSDGDARTKIDMEYYRETGIKAGRMANIPAGEVFFTPESISGSFIGDVVIAIDQSYVLNHKEPIIVSVENGSYRIVKAPKAILDKLNKKKMESWKMILEEEKHNSLPRAITELKKKNFNRIGEFAINTNPKAKLCNYLIVNEKIAHMIHIALGSGFEPDRATSYHIDIVIDAKYQKFDIFGTKQGKKVWIMKQGKLLNHNL